MVFSSLVFIFLFLPLFFLLYFLVPNRKYRNFILLGCSLFFYAWGEPIYVVCMIGSIVMNYILAILMEKSTKRRKAVFILAVILNIGMLIVFKYSNFIIDNINMVFSLSLAHVNISLPIGISFYTFQILSYVIDLYKGEVALQKNILTLGAYITAFPQLIAGPIVRYETVEYELANRKESLSDFYEGTKRFVLGLSKKVLIANNMAFVADTVFNKDVTQFGMIGAWIGLICYTLQIYFDFSGYSDMAIGLGKMMGFNYLENFNYPYISKSITDFWRRWHISLSTFFRDYIYIPLGGNRVSPLKWYRNILIVWILTGLWHGASWNFVLWGLYYGFILILEKKWIGKYLKKVPVFISHLYAIILILFGWLIFRAETLSSLSVYIQTLFGVHGWGNVDTFIHTQLLQVKYLVTLVVGIICCTPLFKRFKEKLEILKGGTYVYDFIILVLYVLCINMLLIGGFNPFIYFRF